MCICSASQGDSARYCATKETLWDYDRITCRHSMVVIMDIELKTSLY